MPGNMEVIPEKNWYKYLLLRSSPCIFYWPFTETLGRDLWSGTLGLLSDDFDQEVRLLGRNWWLVRGLCCTGTQRCRSAITRSYGLWMSGCTQRWCAAALWLTRTVILTECAVCKKTCVLFPLKLVLWTPFPPFVRASYIMLHKHGWSAEKCMHCLSFMDTKDSVTIFPKSKIYIVCVFKK